jgi:hypothetical protein
MNLRVPQNVGNILTNRKPVSCSRRTLFHGGGGRAAVRDDNPEPFRLLIFVKPPWLLHPWLFDQNLLEASNVRPFALTTSDSCADYSMTNRLLRCSILHVCFRVTLLINVILAFVTGRAAKESHLSVAVQISGDIAWISLVKLELHLLWEATTPTEQSFKSHIVLVPAFNTKVWSRREL